MNRRNPPIVLLFALVFLGAVLCFAQEPEDERIQAENLPERIEARIIDVTKVDLLQRPPFSDPALPDIPIYTLRFPKEKPWNLPGFLLPGRESPDLERSWVEQSFDGTLLTGVPSAFMAKVEANKETPESVRPGGAINLHWETLGDSRTNRRGKSNRLGLMTAGAAVIGKSDLTARFRYEMDDVGWITSADQISRHDRSLLTADIDVRQVFSETTSTNMSLDFARSSITGPFDSSDNRASDIEFRFDADVSYPFLNPIKLGFSGRYSTRERKDLGNSSVSMFRIYGRDNYWQIGPFVLSLGLAAAVYAEPRADAQNITYQTKFVPNPSVEMMTLFGSSLAFQMKADIFRVVPLEAPSLYRDDHMLVNPVIRPEKLSDIRGVMRADLGGPVLRMEAFYQFRNDLIVPIPTTTDTVTWQPENLDARTYGLVLGLDGEIIPGLTASASYRHEFHDAGDREHIPYRSPDLAHWTITYETTGGIEIALSGEIVGVRYVDSDDDDRIDPYVLFEPSVRVPLGGGISGYLQGAFYTIEPETMKGYSLPRSAFDFGVRLEFQ